MRPFLPFGLILLAVSLSAPLHAKSVRPDGDKGEPKDPVWAIAKAEDAYVLRYGPARSSNPLFAAACRPAAQLLQITVEVSSSKIKGGDGVPVSLVAGPRRLELAATAFRGERTEHVVVEAAVSLQARVLDLFAAGDELKVSMPGTSTVIPLAEAKARLADFRRVCLPGAEDRR